MGVLYKPFSILARMLAKRMGQAAVSDLWGRVGDSAGPPPPNAGRRPLGSVFATAAVQAAILAGVGAVVDQLAARAFHQIFGAWPGKPVELEASDAPAAAA